MLTSRLNSRLFTSLNRIHLRYTDKHEWVHYQDNIGRVGITDYAQSKLGDIVFVQLPEVGTIISQSDEVAALESVKAASEVYSPVSGKITEVNQKVEKETSLVNNAAESDGWLFQIKLDNEEELDSLMTPEEYANFIEGED